MKKTDRVRHPDLLELREVVAAQLGKQGVVRANSIGAVRSRLPPVFNPGTPAPKANATADPRRTQRQPYLEPSNCSF